MSSPKASTTKGTVSNVTTRHHKNGRHNVAKKNDHFSANFLRFYAPNHCAKQQTTENISSTQPINSHAMDAVTTSTPSFVVLSFCFVQAQVHAQVRLSFHRATVRCFSVCAAHDKRDDMTNFPVVAHFSALVPVSSVAVLTLDNSKSIGSLVSVAINDLTDFAPHHASPRGRALLFASTKWSFLCNSVPQSL